MGWLGVQGERYFGTDRMFSGFVGLGWTPEIDQGDPDGPAGAIGGRDRLRLHLVKPGAVPFP